MAHKREGEEAKFADLGKLEVNADQLADLFRVKRPTVLHYAREAGMPRIARGRYPLLECVNWYVDKLRAMAEGEGDMSEERKKLIRAQRTRHEIEAERLRGQLIDAEEVSTVLHEIGVIFTSQLEAMPARTAPQVLGLNETGAVVGVLREAVKNVRRSTSTAIENYTGAYQPRGHSKPPANPKRRGMGRRK